MSTAVPLQPTLWRTCRVLANRTRLEMFSLLLKRPGQSVSAIARRLDYSLPVTSQYLRALEARGLLKASRKGRGVEYQPGPVADESPASGLVTALQATFQRERRPVETVFRLATAFTHPHRIEIFRALNAGLRTTRQIRAATGISGWALARHLQKLKARGFITFRRGSYTVVPRSDRLGRELTRLATGAF